MEQKIENHCDLDDIRAIKDAILGIYQVSESKSERVEKSIDEIHELTITCKSDSMFPEQIGYLLNLHSLTLVGGNFEEVSAEIGKLRKLKRLILLNTQLKKLPIELYKIPNLNTLAIMYNMNEFEFQQDLCKEDFKLNVIYTSSKIKGIPNCLNKDGKLKLTNKDTY